MSSIIDGFNYDIFISYRQKDNKHDGWVTEFVNNLKGELESAFKEEVSVYFDINPHDGLLETHDVDASLKEKLKCLIFIPIISRTYCDPKSFAWEHEFKAFVEMAAKDRFGLKVKLPNGNVAGRVLPVRIHELDEIDIKKCENVLGGFLRGIDFIYKEAGVNRPMKPDDDEKTNIYKTKYRNQINKIANAIQDVINSLKGGAGERDTPLRGNKSSRVREKSIIVLPFDNLSPDPEQEYFSDGLTEEIITDLSYIHDLLVISRSSAMTFKGSKKTIPEISREVNVRYVLEGSVRKSGNNLRIVAQLIDAETDSHVWSEKFNGTLDDIFDIQEKVSGSISRALKLKLTGEEKDKLSEVKISDIVSYEFYIQAKKHMWSFSENSLDHALKLTNQALSLSGDNALLYATRALIFWQYQNTGVRPSPEVLEKADRDADRAIELDAACSLGYRAKASVAFTRGQLEASVLNYRKGASLESGGESLFWLGYLHALAGQMDMARVFAERAARVDPLNDLGYDLWGIIEIYGGNFNKAATLLKRALEINHAAMHYLFLAIALYYAGNREESVSCLKKFGNEPGVPDSMSNMWLAAIRHDEKEFLKYSNLVKEYAIHDKEVSWFLADCYSIMGNTDESLYWIENAINMGLINHIFFSEVDPNLNEVRTDPRFNVLMEKAIIREQKFMRVTGCNKADEVFRMS
jgi:TolB-like protein/tetratricopeptide (TPR) repeat protein